MPKVYVATAFVNLQEAREVMTSLREMGYQITHDWTNESAEGLVGAEREAYLTRCAKEDVEGVRRADLVFLILHERAKGALTEFGLALAWEIPCIVAKKNEVNDIFTHLDEGVFAFDTLPEALAEAKRMFEPLAVGKGMAAAFLQDVEKVAGRD